MVTSRLTCVCGRYQYASRNSPILTNFTITSTHIHFGTHFRIEPIHDFTKASTTSTKASSSLFGCACVGVDVSGVTRHLFAKFVKQIKERLRKKVILRNRKNGSPILHKAELVTQESCHVFKFPRLLVYSLIFIWEKKIWMLIVFFC